MKSFVISIVITCAVLPGAAQVIYFNNIYPNSDGQNVQFKNIECDTVNEYYEIFGVTGSSGNHNLIKRKIGYDGFFIEDDIVSFGDTSIYAGRAGSFRNIGNGYLATYASYFGGLVEMYDTQWQRQWRYEVFHTDTSATFFDISLKLSDGNWLYAGLSILQYDEIIGDDAAPFELVKLSPNGDEIWRSQIFPEKLFGTPYTLHELPGGDIILTGTQSFDYDAVVLRLDSAGNVLWQHTFQSPPEDERDDLWAQSVLINDSTIVLSYGYGYDDEYPPQPWVEGSVRKLHLVKFNVNSREIIWDIEYPQIYGADHYNNNLIRSMDLGFVVVGNLSNALYWPLVPLDIGFDFSYLAKINADGELQWQRRYTFSSDSSSFLGDQNYLYDIENAPDGGYVACGYLNDYDLSPQYQAWVIKVDEYGCLEPGCQNVAVDEIRLDMQGAMSVFPNPVGSVCTVEFSLSDKQKHVASRATELILTDAIGRHLQNIVLPPMGSQHQLQVDMSGSAVGVYQLHWVSGGAWLDTVQVVKE